MDKPVYYTFKFQILMMYSTDLHKSWTFVMQSCFVEHTYSTLYETVFAWDVRQNNHIHTSWFWQKVKVKRCQLNISLTRSMHRRSAKNFVTISGLVLASADFTPCTARLIQAHARVEAMNTENLSSEEKMWKWLVL